MKILQFLAKKQMQKLLGHKAWLSRRTIFCLLILLIWVVETSAEENQYYTVLAGSYSSVENAEQDYLRLQNKLDSSMQQAMRIELVGGYYTIRVGQFAESSSAEQLLPAIEKYFNGARVLKAFIRPERVLKSNGTLGNIVAVDLDTKEDGGSPGDENISASADNTHTVLDGDESVTDLLTSNTLSLSDELVAQIAGKKFFIVQFGSFSLEKSAIEEFERLITIFDGEPIPWLRIERIQGFYTIRSGKFHLESTADDFAIFLADKNTQSSVLRAYIKPERLVRVFWFNGEGDWSDKVTDKIEMDDQEVVDFGDQKSTSHDYLPGIQAENIETVVPQNFAVEEPELLPVKMLLAEKKKQKVSKTQKDLLSSLDVDPGQEFFTVQIASFSEAALATIEYETFLSRLSPEFFDQLRIEFIKGFFTVRVGKFERRAPSEELLGSISAFYPQASIVYAYVIPQRIQRLYGEDTAPMYSQQIYEELPGAKVVREEHESEVVESEVVEFKEFAEGQKAHMPEAQVELPIIDSPDAELSEKGILTGEESTVRIDSGSEDIVDMGKIVDDGFDDVELVISSSAGSSTEDNTAKIAEDTVIEKIVTDDTEVFEDLGQGSMKSEQASLDSFIEADIDEEKLSGADEKTSDDTREEKIPEFTYEVLTVLTKDDKGENIRMPSSLFYDYNTDELYLINGVNNRLIIYGPDFFPQNSIGRGRGLDSPLSGYFTNDGKIFVTQAGTPSSKPRLTLLNSAFFPEKEIFMQGIPDSENFIPQKVALGKDKSIYITGLSARRVLVLDENGLFKKWFTVAVDKRGDYVFSDATEPEDRAEIKDIEIDPEGNLILLSESTSKVYVFDPNERFLFSFGKKGGAEGKLSRPRAVAFDSKIRCFYVVDYMRHTVLIYDINGNFKYEFGGRGWGPEWFNYPVDIVVGRKGNVVVADFFNQRAQVFEITYRDEFPEKSAEQWGLH